jgi:hypothetical protein
MPRQLRGEYPGTIYHVMSRNEVGPGILISGAFCGIHCCFIPVFRGYDTLGRLISMSLRRQGHAELNRHSYTYAGQHQVSGHRGFDSPGALKRQAGNGP